MKILLIFSLLCSWNASANEAPDAKNSPQPFVSKYGKSEGKKGLWKTHNALFEIYFPINDPSIPLVERELALKARDEIYGIIIGNGQLKLLVAAIGNVGLAVTSVVDWLYNLATGLEPEQINSKKDRKESIDEIQEFIRARGAKKLHQLNEKDRYLLLKMMAGSRSELLKRASNSLSSFYKLIIYSGELGKRIAGVWDQEQQNPARPNLKTEDLGLTTHLKYDEKKKTIDGELDYLIIGGGSSGSLIAHDLFLAGYKVLIVEKGPMINPLTYDGVTEARFLFNNGLLTNKSGDRMVIMGSVTGGGSTVNLNIAFPATHFSVKQHFDEWREKGIIKTKDKEIWSAQEISDATDYVMNLIPIRTLNGSDANKNNQLLYEGAKKSGFNPEYNLLSINEGDAHVNEDGTQNTVKNTSYSALIKAIQNNKNPALTAPTILSDINVEKIIFDNNTAVGVKATKTAYKDIPGTYNDIYNLKIPDQARLNIRAKKIILSAGALGSTIVLKNSEVKNNNIGKGIVMHPVFPILGMFPFRVDNFTGIGPVVHVDSFLTRDHKQKQDDTLIETNIYPPARVALFLPGEAKEIYNTIKKYRHMGGSGVFLLEETQMKNRVKVKKNGKFVVEHRLSVNDQVRLLRAIGNICRMIFSAKGTECIVPFNGEVGTEEGRGNGEAFSIKSVEQLNLLEKQMMVTLTDEKAVQTNLTITYSAHMLGLNKIGPGPKTSVVNLDHEVWGKKNLYVVDASVFPTSTGANPMMTIYAMSHLFVKNHLKKMSETGEPKSRHRPKQ